MNTLKNVLAFIAFIEIVLGIGAWLGYIAVKKNLFGLKKNINL